MKTILLVDDEMQILKALSRTFFDTDYEIITASGGEEALQILEKTKVDLIISDMRMPLMDGYEFLKIAKERQPDAIRIILSGYSDEMTIFKAIFHNIAKIYFLKPWNNEELLKRIVQLFETEEQLKSKNILQLINNIELPTIQSSYEKILFMIENMWIPPLHQRKINLLFFHFQFSSKGLLPNLQ